MVLANVLHEFSACGQISQWSMVFRCTASRGGNGYPLELQVFRQAGSARRFRLRSRAQVTIQDEQCDGQLVTFNVSLPFCQGEHVGIYVPNLPGRAAAGLGYKATGNSEDTYLDQDLSVPPSVGNRVSFAITDIESEVLPLVSIEGNVVYQLVSFGCSSVCFIHVLALSVKL